MIFSKRGISPYIAASIPAKKSGVSTGMSGRDAAKATFFVALYVRDFHFC
jgi:hypothetical protein